MSHSLPLAGSPLRELFEVRDLVAIATGEQPVQTFGRALSSARRLVRENRAVRAVHFIALEAASDNLCLYRVGSRGGHKRLWVFGPVGRKARLG